MADEPRVTISMAARVASLVAPRMAIPLAIPAKASLAASAATRCSAIFASSGAAPIALARGTTSANSGARR